MVVYLGRSVPPYDSISVTGKQGKIKETEENNETKPSQKTRQKNQKNLQQEQRNRIVGVGKKCRGRQFNES